MEIEEVLEEEEEREVEVRPRSSSYVSVMIVNDPYMHVIGE